MSSKLRFPSPLTAVSLLLGSALLAGCGGHGSSGSSTGATDDVIFNNGKVAPVTAEAKATDHAKLSALFGSSWARDNGLLAHQLVAMMQTMPEFREGAISTDGTAWGRYTDGTLLMFMTNDGDAPSVTSMLSRAASAGQRPAIATTSKAAGGAKDLPKSAVAYVFNAFEPKRSQAVAPIVTELTKAGYTVHSGTGSLDDWLGVSNAAVLFNDSHGSTIDRNFYIQTSVVPTPALNDQYFALINRGDLTEGDIEVLDDSPAGRHVETRYLFDVDFLKRSNPNFGSMFAKNSLFLNASCCGTRPEAGRLISTLQTAGLAVYGGWDNSVLTVDGTELALFFFDRALGLNQTPPIDPGLPAPASISSIDATLGTAAHQDGNSGAMNLSNGLVFRRGSTVGSPIDVHFKFVKANDQALTTIIPSATSAGLTTDGQNMEVQGDFGADQGTVTVAGNSVAVLSWTANKIVAAKPDAQGAVVVTSPTGLIGNAVPFTASLSRITPFNPYVGRNGTQTFTVSPEVGQFPTGATFTWTLSGGGSIGSSNTVKTSTASIAYTAPSSDASASLSVVVADSSGETIAKTSTNITVSNTQVIHPLVLWFNSGSYSGPDGYTYEEIQGLVVFQPIAGAKKYEMHVDDPNLNNPSAPLTAAQYAAGAPVWDPTTPLYQTPNPSAYPVPYGGRHVDYPVEYNVFYNAAGGIAWPIEGGQFGSPAPLFDAAFAEYFQSQKDAAAARTYTVVASF